MPQYEVVLVSRTTIKVFAENVVAAADLAERKRPGMDALTVDMQPIFGRCGECRKHVTDTDSFTHDSHGGCFHTSCLPAV